jgi:peptidoglycan/LPS O-acetylase OafA/YrhL
LPASVDAAGQPPAGQPSTGQPTAVQSSAGQPADGRAERKRPRLAVLDGLRLVAALMVVAYHYIAQGDSAWQRDSADMFGVANTVTSYGWLGVELFFVISGFVICMSAWGRGLGEFFVSRAVRLYPAYWFAIVAITVAVSIAPVLQKRLVSSEILVNFTMLQSPVGVPGASAVFWTLWLELHFYLLFGLVVWRGLTYRRVVLFCLVWTIGSVVAEKVDDRRLSLLVDEQYSPFFIAGIVMFLMYRFRPTLLLWGILGVSWALGMLKTVSLTRSMGHFVGQPVSWRPAAVIVTVEFVLVVAVALGWLSGVRGRWLTVAGALTYPLYLLHLEIGWMLIRVLHDRVPTWPLLITLTAAMLGLAWLVHRYIERPIAPWMKRKLTEAVAEIREHAESAAPAESAVPAERSTVPAERSTVSEPERAPEPPAQRTPEVVEDRPTRNGSDRPAVDRSRRNDRPVRIASHQSPRSPAQDHTHRPPAPDHTHRPPAPGEPPRDDVALNHPAPVGSAQRH